MATYTRVKASTLGTAFASSVNTSFATLPSAGNLIVVMGGSRLGSGASYTVSDNQGNTYHLAKQSISLAGSSATAIYYAWNIGSPSGTFTITWAEGTGATRTWAKAVEYSGFGTLDPLFTTGEAFGSGSSTSTGAISTSNPDAVELSCCAVQLGSAPTITSSTPASPAWTTEYAIGGFNGGCGSSRIVATAGTQSATWSAGDNIASIIAVFQDPSDFSATRATQALESRVVQNTTSANLTQVVQSRVFENTSEVRNTQVVLTLIVQNPVIPTGPIPNLTPFKRWGIERFDIKVRSEDSS